MATSESAMSRSITISLPFVASNCRIACCLRVDASSETTGCARGTCTTHRPGVAGGTW